jgi:hypothetical protein
MDNEIVEDASLIGRHPHHESQKNRTWILLVGSLGICVVVAVIIGLAVGIPNALNAAPSDPDARALWLMER